MPNPRGEPVWIHVLVDSYYVGDKVTRRSQTGVLISINMASIIWFSKKQNSVQTSIFGLEFTAMKQAVNMTQALCCKLRMFCIRLTGPASVYCDNEALYKNVSISESVLKKKHHLVLYHACRDAVAYDMIRVAMEYIMENLADLFTNTMPKVFREILLGMFIY